MHRLRISALLLPLLLSCDDHERAAPTEANLDETRRTENLGEGNQYRLIGSAQVTRDPENPTNIVLQVVSTAASAPSGIQRDLRRVQLWQLDHQLNFHRAFVAPHTCGGGSPRIQLLIDADGDNRFEQVGVVPGGRDFVAHGHVRPPHTGCETSAPTANPGGPAPSTLLWRFEDLTDELNRWEITPGSVMTQLGLPAFPYAMWDTFEQVVSAAFPNHQGSTAG